MKRNSVYFLCVLLVCLLFTGCLGEEQKEEPALPSPSPAGSVMETITIYSINSDTMSLVPVSVKKTGKKLDGKSVVSLVTGNLNGIDIKITAVVQKGKKIYVSFSSDSKPVVSCNKTMEKLILDCLSNSILDNVDSCHQVIFQKEGKAYQSEHRSFGLKEVYASK